MKSFKTTPFAIKFLLWVILISLAIFYFLPVDEFGSKCGRESLVPYIILLLGILLPLMVAIIERLKRKISNSIFGVILLILILFFLVIFIITLSQGCPRCGYPWWVTRGDMNQLKFVQEMFYEKNNRYADTQEELIADVKIFNEKLKNRITGEEFTDKDGKGIEAGDNNPETWAVVSYIRYKKFNKWCRMINEEYMYICDQDGCYKETEILEKEPINWQTYRNEKYGFEIKYPQELLIVQNLTNSGGEFQYCLSTQEDTNHLCKAIIGFEFPDTNFKIGLFIIEMENNKYGYSDNPNVWYSLDRKFGYELVYASDQMASKPSNLDKNIFNQMLSTFRFIEEEVVEETIRPTITVIFPNGREELIVGEDYLIRWRAEGIENIDIKLWMPTPGPGGWPPGVSRRLVGNWPVDKEFFWTVTKDDYDFAENSRKLFAFPASTFKILIFKSGVYNIYDSSDGYLSIKLP